MVWGCIGWNGVGVLSEVEGQMDAEQYVAILEQELLQIMENSGIPEDDIIFQPDNDPKHTSRRAQIWFEEQEIKLCTSLHNLQTLIPLNILGVISRDASQGIRVLLQEFINCGNE
jgi:hypothetical protein